MLGSGTGKRRVGPLVSLYLALVIIRSSVCHKVHDLHDKEHERFERDILLGEDDVEGYFKLSNEEKVERLR